MKSREGRKECLLCDAECESVSHVLWDCPAHASIRSAFMLELREGSGSRFEHFQSLNSFEKLLVLSVWEERKGRLYGEHANVQQSLILRMTEGCRRRGW